MKTLSVMFVFLLSGLLMAEERSKVYFRDGNVYLGNPDSLLLEVSEESIQETLEEELLRLTNEARVRVGLKTLTPHPALTAAAGGHAAEMSELNYFSHTSPTPALRTTRQRVQRNGANPKLVAENIFECSGYDKKLAPRFALEAFLQSPGHRANLLNPSVTHIGIGLSEVSGRISISQVLGEF